MTLESQRKMYVLCTERINYFTQKVNDLQGDMKAAEHQLERWKEAQKEFKGVICNSCSGMGKLREFVAQDESRIVTCDMCEGSGVVR